MKTNSTNHGKKVYRQITLAFVLLAIALESMLTGYWFFMLQPRLHQEAKVAANLIAQAQAVTLANVIQKHKKVSFVQDITLAMDKILLSVDTTTNTQFIHSLSIELDRELFAPNKQDLILERGDFNCINCFISGIPLYDQTSFELLGVATFYVNDEFFQSLNKDVQTKLLAESVISLIFLFLTWRLTLSLSRRLERQTQNRKQAEHALQEKDLQYKRLLNQLSQYFIYTRDSRGEFTTVSESITKILGCSPSEFQQNFLRYLTVNPSNHYFIQHYQDTEQVARESTCEIEMLDNNENPHWIELSEIAIKDNQGKIILREGIGRDITDARNTQNTLEQARQLAEQANQTKSNFLANMSHEIRTPMNAIMGMSYLALKTNLTDQQQDYLTKIQSSSRGLLGIINDILDFSKIEAGKLAMEEIDFNLDEVLENLATICTPKSAEKGLEFIINKSATIPNLLVGDPLRLGQVLINLVTNAIKFTELGKVTIFVECIQKTENNIELRFTIKDTGIGISPEQASKLFQSFSQVDSSITRRFGGTGLGLAISQHLVNLMQGEIKVESTLGKGSVFSFNTWLHLSQKDNITEPKPSNTLLKGLKALVVDDDPTERELIVEMLNHYAINTHSVDSGKVALSQLEQATNENVPYDLVLMDWKMPAMDGIETINLIRSNQSLQYTPTMIMVNAYPKDDLIKQTQQTKVDGIITKPINASLLINCIMNSFSSIHANELNAKPHRIDPSPKDFSSISKKVVLLAEDNSINQQVARELLEAMQLSVVIANNGKEALEAINIKQFDLILMDLQMPEMDGFEATIAIRKQTQFNDLPIIAMTAHTLSGDKEKCLSAGMNDHVAKPIDPDNLSQTLTKWLGTDLPSSHKDRVSDSMDISFVDDDLSGINQAEGLKKINNNHSLYLKLLREFHEDHGKTASNIQKALKQGDKIYAQHLTHNIKGVAGNLGANNLFNSATQLEKALIEKINYKELLILFVKDFEIVMEALTKINCVETINPQPSKNNTIDIQEVNQCIKLLKNDLEKHCFQSSESLAVLSKVLGNNHAEIYHQLENKIDKFLFEPALKCLDELNIKISENIK